MSLTLNLIVDPMCSWCWGFRSVWSAFSESLPRDVDVVDLMGGLAPDSDTPMDADTRAYVQGAWHAVGKRTGAQFNFDFWKKATPRRSTYPACRAVIAAGLQEINARARMYDAIQTAFFLEARNPSLTSELEALAEQIGLDRGRFADNLLSERVDLLFQSERETARRFGVTGFPTVIWCWQAGDESPRYGLLAAGYTDGATLSRRWQELVG